MVNSGEAGLNNNKSTATPEAVKEESQERRGSMLPRTKPATITSSSSIPSYMDHSNNKPQLANKKKTTR